MKRQLSRRRISVKSTRNNHGVCRRQRLTVIILIRRISDDHECIGSLRNLQSTLLFVDLIVIRFKTLRCFIADRVDHTVFIGNVRSSSCSCDFTNLTVHETIAFYRYRRCCQLLAVIFPGYTLRNQTYRALCHSQRPVIGLNICKLCCYFISVAVFDDVRINRILNASNIGNTAGCLNGNCKTGRQTRNVRAAFRQCFPIINLRRTAGCNDNFTPVGKDRQRSLFHLNRIIIRIEFLCRRICDRIDYAARRCNRSRRRNITDFTRRKAIAAHRHIRCRQRLTVIHFARTLGC